MQVDRVSTGSEVVDELLDGGLEKGVITNVYGGSGTGKTNLCIQASAEIAGDGKVAYIDTEGGFSPERVAQVKDKEVLDNIIIKSPMTFEEQADTISGLEDVVEKHDLDLVVVDSIVSLYRLNVDDENASQANQKLSNQLSELSRIARKNDIPVLVTNQVYKSFNEERKELVGRDVPRYWSKCLLQMKEESGREIRIEKHRSIAKGKTRTFKITDEGLKETDDEGLF